MIIPIRCFSCGKVVGNKWEYFEKAFNEGIPVNEILDTLGLRRYCCRRMLLTNSHLIDKMTVYSIPTLKEDNKN